MSPRPDLRLAPLAVLAVLLVLGAALLYCAPVHRYVVACEHGTSDVVCVLERQPARTTGGGAQRWRVPLGTAAAAVVRKMPQRRGPARVLLYLESPGREAPVFAAEFEGADASVAATVAAAQLNRVLRGTAGPGAAARVEAEAPPILRWVAWAGLGVMGLLVLAAYRHVRAPTTGAA
jgi:hypothetical protein